MFIVER